MYVSLIQNQVGIYIQVMDKNETCSVKGCDNRVRVRSSVLSIEGDR